MPSGPRTSISSLMVDVGVGDHLPRQLGPALGPNLGEEPSDQCSVSFGIHRAEASPSQTCGDPFGVVSSTGAGQGRWHHGDGISPGPATHPCATSANTSPLAKAPAISALLRETHWDGGRPTGKRATSESHGERPLVVYR